MGRRHGRAMVGSREPVRRYDQPHRSGSRIFPTWVQQATLLLCGLVVMAALSAWLIKIMQTPAMQRFWGTFGETIGAHGYLSEASRWTTRSSAREPSELPVLRYRHRVPDVRLARVDRGKLHYSLGSHARAHSFIENVPSLRLRFRVLVYGGSAEGTSRSRSYETLTEQKPRGLSTRALAGAAVA
jgi:hypothetical protein